KARPGSPYLSQSDLARLCRFESVCSSFFLFLRHSLILSKKTMSKTIVNKLPKNATIMVGIAGTPPIIANGIIIAISKNGIAASKNIIVYVINILFLPQNYSGFNQTNKLYGC